MSSERLPNPWAHAVGDPKARSGRHLGGPAGARSQAAGKGASRPIAVAAVAAAAVYGAVGEAWSHELYEAAVVTLAYVMLALGLNLAVGFAGLLDLGYVAFLALGAFAAAWLMSTQFADQSVHIGVSDTVRRLPGIHVNFFLVLFLAAGFAGFLGALLRAPALRLRGNHLAVVTLALGLIVPQLLEHATGLTNGPRGITPIDRPWVPVPGLEHVTREDIKPLFFIALAMTVAVAVVTTRLRSGRIGRAWRAMREDETAAACAGVPIAQAKLWAYAISAAIGGFAGAFLAVLNSFVNVDQFGLGFSIFILCMVVLGGARGISGVIVAAVGTSLGTRFVLPELHTASQRLGVDVNLALLSSGLFGLCIVLVTLLRADAAPARAPRL
jgi:branched-chain amino acid transport system permease protein